MPKKIDLTGQKFGRLKVLYKNGSNKNGLIIWHCICDCGNECDKIGVYLRDGSVISCGCYLREVAKLNHIKTNKYDLTQDYGIGFDCHNNEFYFDLEDYDKIKEYCWRKRPDGYFDAKRRDGSGKRILLHNLVLGCKYVDHIGGTNTIHDNRKRNLRVSNNSELSFETINNMNKNKQSNNKSGQTGVIWHSRDNIWESYISINNKQIYLGRFEDFNDAVKARKEAEEKYFGEYSYDNSQKIVSNF